MEKVLSPEAYEANVGTTDSELIIRARAPERTHSGEVYERRRRMERSEAEEKTTVR